MRIKIEWKSNKIENQIIWKLNEWIEWSEKLKIEIKFEIELNQLKLRIELNKWND